MKRTACILIFILCVLLCACGAETVPEAAPTPELTPEITPAPTPTPKPTIHSDINLTPFAPDEMHDLVAATYYLKGEPHTVGDADAFESLNRCLCMVRRAEEQTPLENTAVMFLRRGDGAEFRIEIAEDEHCEFMADGVRYIYSEEPTTELLSMFWYHEIHERLTAGKPVDEIMELITRVNWRRYARDYGEEETMALIKMFGEWVLEGDGIEHYRELFDSTRGIENSYLEAYAYYVTEAYELHKQQFCNMALHEVSTESYYRVVDMLCSYWATSRDNLWTRFNTAANTGY